MDNSDKESSDSEYVDLDDYDKPYMGRLEEDDDFFGAISLTKPFAENGSVMDPMEGPGPAISLEDDFDEGLFPSLDPKNHPYRMDDDILMAPDSGHTNLQLGTVGSHAKFNFGTTMKTSYGGIDEDVYFDIVNIDRYDANVGTRFMRKHGILLDFERGQVLIRGQSAPTLSEGEDHAEFTRRSSMRWDTQAEKFRRKDSDKSLE